MGDMGMLQQLLPNTLSSTLVRIRSDATELDSFFIELLMFSA